MRRKRTSMQWALGATKLLLLSVLVSAAGEVAANNSLSPTMERLHKSAARNAASTASRLEQNEAKKKSQIERLHKTAKVINSKLEESEVPVLDQDESEPTSSETLQDQVDLEVSYQQKEQARESRKEQNAIDRSNKQNNQSNQNIRRLDNKNQREAPSPTLQNNQSGKIPSVRNDPTISISQQENNNQARQSTNTRQLANQKQRHFIANSSDASLPQEKEQVKKEQVNNHNSYRKEQLRGIDEHYQGEINTNNYKHHFVSYKHRSNMRSQNQTEAEAEDKSAENAAEGDERSSDAASVATANKTANKIVTNTNEDGKINKAIIATIIVIFIILMSLSIPLYALFVRFRTKRPSNKDPAIKTQQ